MHFVVFMVFISSSSSSSFCDEQGFPSCSSLSSCNLCMSNPTCVWCSALPPYNSTRSFKMIGKRWQWFHLPWRCSPREESVCPEGQLLVDNQNTIQVKHHRHKHHQHQHHCHQWKSSPHVKTGGKGRAPLFRLWPRRLCPDSATGDSLWIFVDITALLTLASHTGHGKKLMVCRQPLCSCGQAPLVESSSRSLKSVHVIVLVIVLVIIFMSIIVVHEPPHH